MQRLSLCQRVGSARFVTRRLYHELSYASHGEPRTVLQFLNFEKERDQDPPSNLNDAVRVEMWHAPLNPADINTVQGKYPSPDSNRDDSIRQSRFAPERTVAGSEGWGCVTHVVGDSCSLQVGDTVVVGQPGLGTFRSSFWTPPTSVLPLSQGHDMKELLGSQAACTIPQLGGTALRMLRDFVTLEPGDVVLQNAGNSGVGFMASQLGKALLGVSVVSIVRRGERSAHEWEELVEHLTSEGKCAMVVAQEDLTSREAIKDFQAKLRALSGSGRLPLLTLNAVGGESASMLCKCLDTGGTIVTYGGMSMKPVTLATPQLIFRDLRATGYWHSRWMVQNSLEARQQLLNELADAALTKGVVAPPIVEFPLSQVDEALNYNQNETAIRRKVVFRCQE